MIKFNSNVNSSVNSSKHSPAFVIAFAIVLALIPFSAKGDGHGGMMEGIEIGGDVGWHSRYITNSRKEGFGQTGMFSGNLGATYDKYFGNIWWAYSDSNSDNEVNFEVGRGFDLTENISLSAYYVYLVYGSKTTLKGRAHDDHEIHTVLSCSDCLPMGVSPSMKVIYEMEDNNYLVRLTLSKSFEMESVTISPYVEAQYDHGYGSAKHDGMNSYVVGISASRPLTEDVGLKVYLKQLFQGEDLRQQDSSNTAHDVTWFGASLTF